MAQPPVIQTPTTMPQTSGTTMSTGKPKTTAISPTRGVGSRPTTNPQGVGSRPTNQNTGAAEVPHAQSQAFEEKMDEVEPLIQQTPTPATTIEVLPRVSQASRIQSTTGTSSSANKGPSESPTLTWETAVPTSKTGLLWMGPTQPGFIDHDLTSDVWRRARQMGFQKVHTWDDADYNIVSKKLLSSNELGEMLRLHQGTVWYSASEKLTIWTNRTVPLAE